MTTDVVEVRRFKVASELWDALGPTHQLFPDPSKPVFRGHANANWQLTPRVLRSQERERARAGALGGMSASDQVFHEIRLLEVFAGYCDRVGVRIPGDSIAFRTQTLTSQRQDRYYINPSEWPNPELYEVMALAQHHGVPTRLLDWTRQPYAAAYFAAAGALAAHGSWKKDDCLAIWALNLEFFGLVRDVMNVVGPPGAVSPHLAAQAGLFTVQRQEGDRASPLVVRPLETSLKGAPSNTLIKMMLPVRESARLFDLCLRIGISAASLFPSADGAARAVEDDINLWSARRLLQETVG